MSSPVMRYRPVFPSSIARNPGPGATSSTRLPGATRFATAWATLVNRLRSRAAFFVYHVAIGPSIGRPLYAFLVVVRVVVMRSPVLDQWLTRHYNSLTIDYLNNQDIVWQGLRSRPPGRTASAARRSWDRCSSWDRWPAPKPPCSTRQRQRSLVWASRTRRRFRCCYRKVP